MRFVVVERVLDGRAAVVTLNRPEARNAINRQLGEELAACLAELRDDAALRAVIITGAGAAFSAGVDLKDPLFADPEVMTRGWIQGPRNYLWQMQQFQVPLLAAVNGPCVTGAMEIALQCDIIIASTKALFRDTHSTYGIPPAGGMSQILQRMIGLQRARYMSLTGAKVDGATAYEWGLACMVVEPEELMAKARAVAGVIAEKDRATTATFRRLIDEGQGRSMQEALDYEIDTVLTKYAEMGSGGGSTQERLSDAFAAQQRRVRSKM